MRNVVLPGDNAPEIADATRPGGTADLARGVAATGAEARPGLADQPGRGKPSGSGDSRAAALAGKASRRRPATKPPGPNPLHRGRDNGAGQGARTADPTGRAGNAERADIVGTVARGQPVATLG